jgi:hypothetical protein
MGVKQHEFNNSSVSLSEAEEFVREVIDVHVHGPDKIPRRYNPDGKDLLFEQKKIAGLVLKSHFRHDIVKMANWLTNKSEGDLNVFGSLTLNYGFKADEVEQIKKEAGGRPFVIWGPTIAAKAFLEKIQGEYAIPLSWVKGSNFPPIKKNAFRPVTCFDKKHSLTRETLNVLSALVGTRGVLASGHLSGEETYQLGMVARKKNIPFIATHVLLGGRSSLTEEQMKDLSQRGAWLEFCYIYLKDEDWDGKYNRKEIVNQIKKFLSYVVVSTDCGQVRNPPPSLCMIECVRLLSAYDLNLKELKKVIIDNPRKILGLDRKDNN